MAKLPTSAIVVATCFALTRCGVVEHLPGAGGATDISQHTGYLEGSPGQQTFYWLVEAETKADSSPLLVWMNGGPGSSSVMGLLHEIGPLQLNGKSMPGPGSKDWTLFRNPYGWHRAANVLVWEQPIGVGYSYCAGGDCPHPWNDTSSAHANLQILRAFLKSWPKFRNRELYITGESYGGVYVPMLADLVSRKAPEVQLRGIAVGNGCIGFDPAGAVAPDTLSASLEYLEGAGAIEASEAADVRRACGDDQMKAAVGPGGASELSPPCRRAMKSVAQQLGDYNSYHFGSTCSPDDSGNWGGGSYACGVDAAGAAYLNDEGVRRALGTFGVGPAKWQEWDGDGPDYTIIAADVLPVYRSLLDSGVRVLVYHGLLDTSSSQNAEQWVAKLGGPAVSRRPWTSGDGHAAGRVSFFAPALRYVTIRGAGHMVPADRPREAFAMISAWLAGEELPEYAGGCQRIWLGRGWADFCEDETQVSEEEEDVVIFG